MQNKTSRKSTTLEERIVKYALAASEYKRMAAELQTRLEPAIDNILNTLRHYGLKPFAARRIVYLRRIYNAR
ncbi:hypothetical protein E2553_33345 [Paraburkholderia dipogonis]|uniref:Uncharacterized protein n=1 Tax=Paraburkholderia dipogonis TaxID=1211383 RepID=A0A4Y8MVL5_9BURK|nr:hypothetical protein [Paraburkholderia dipogonis]TFE41547.1 hypothetical protein E2553_33345 [Paraburkholderia dipogonis]